MFFKTFRGTLGSLLEQVEKHYPEDIATTSVLSGLNNTDEGRK